MHTATIGGPGAMREPIEAVYIAVGEYGEEPVRFQRLRNGRNLD